ncbi:MAG: hypothetical protein PHY95_00210 [Candidatus ainarchaeum sp.]|nr:hypothetical protein [Candidatus ainarchaeum sp.]
MEGLNQELADFFRKTSELKESIENVIKYKSQARYLAVSERKKKEVVRAGKFLIAKLKTINKQSLQEKVVILEDAIGIFAKDKNYNEKIEMLGRVEMLQPDLEIELGDIKTKPRIFEIPISIPMTEARIDLEEAISDYDNGCFISALVLCRRSYEGALVEAYKDIENHEPIHELSCKNCKATIRKEAYLGITNLHTWAISKGLVNDRLKSFGFLISELGAGGAHPPMKEFPRDREIAKLTITSVIALLNQLYSNMARGDDAKKSSLSD